MKDSELILCLSVSNSSVVRIGISPSSVVSSLAYNVILSTLSIAQISEKAKQQISSHESGKMTDPLLCKKQAMPIVTILLPLPYQVNSGLCCSEMQWQCITRAEYKTPRDTSQTCSMVWEPCRSGREAIQNGRTYTRVHSSSCNTGIVHNSGPFHICNFDCWHPCRFPCPKIKQTHF